jgi:hypothetical protein
MVYQTDGTAGLYVYSGSAWIIQADWYTNTGTPASSFALNTPAGLQLGATANYGIGAGALNALTTGDNNTALGYDAAKAITSNGNSTAVGYSALSAATGGGNTAIGRAAGSTVTSGTNNTLIGNQADVASNNLTNATALGYGANVGASNAIQLGNSSVTKVTTFGSVGIGTTSPDSNAVLELSSTSKGILLPRLTLAQRNTINTPTAGLVIYNTDNNKFQGYTSTPNSTWINTNSTNTSSSGTTYTGPNSYDSQTFTPPSTEFLSSVQAYLNTSLNTSTSVTAKVYLGTYNGSGSPIASSNSVTTNSSGGWVQFTFSSPPKVVYNTTYTIVFLNSGTGDLYINQTSPSTYSGGSQFGDPNDIDLILRFRINGSWADLN